MGAESFGNRVVQEKANVSIDQSYTAQDLRGLRKAAEEDVKSGKAGISRLKQQLEENTQKITTLAKRITRTKEDVGRQENEKIRNNENFTKSLSAETQNEKTWKEKAEALKKQEKEQKRVNKHIDELGPKKADLTQKLEISEANVTTAKEARNEAVRRITGTANQTNQYKARLAELKGMQEQGKLPANGGAEMVQLENNIRANEQQMISLKINGQKAAEKLKAVAAQHAKIQKDLAKVQKDLTTFISKSQEFEAKIIPEARRQEQVFKESYQQAKARRERYEADIKKNEELIAKLKNGVTKDTDAIMALNKSSADANTRIASLKHLEQGKQVLAKRAAKKSEGYVTETESPEKIAVHKVINEVGTPKNPEDLYLIKPNVAGNPAQHSNYPTYASISPDTTKVNSDGTLTVEAMVMGADGTYKKTEMRVHPADIDQPARFGGDKKAERAQLAHLIENKEEKVKLADINRDYEIAAAKERRRREGPQKIVQAGVEG